MLTKQEMRFLFQGEHLYPPVIVNAKEIYDADENIEIHCQPKLPIKNGPRPSIKWYLNGQMVS